MVILISHRGESSQTCQRAAGSTGACMINEEEAQPPSGGDPRCIVTFYGTKTLARAGQPLPQAVVCARRIPDH